MHRYHLKHLTFGPYEGDGVHPDPAIDAICKCTEERFKKTAGKTEMELLKITLNSADGKKIGEFDFFGFGQIATENPNLFRWAINSEKEKKKALSKAKKMYYKNHVFDLGVITDPTPLVDIKIGEIPNRLNDHNDILKFIEEFDHEQDLELRPLDKFEFRLLQYLISAPRWIGHNLNPHHPIFADVLHQHIHSSDIYDVDRKIPIPYSIQQKLIAKFGGEPTETQIKDLLEKALDEKE